MKKILSNLEKIQRAWAIGYSTSIVYGIHSMPFLIVAEMTRGFLLNNGHIIDWKTLNENAEIMRHVYAGQLAGKAYVETGTKFRVKKTGKVFEFYPPALQTETIVPLKDDEAFIGYKDYTKNEIEPVFEEKEDHTDRQSAFCKRCNSNIPFNKFAQNSLQQSLEVHNLTSHSENSELPI